MQSVRDVIAHVAGDNVTVLLLGETSVGKEGVAHALHLAPPRASHPVLKVNCAALPEDLLESELFRLQAKLLHVLQDGEFARVGGDSIIQSDVRVIAATTRDLESAIESGRFREDLYLSSQRDRHPRLTVTRTADEIPILADYFLRRFNAECGRSVAMSAATVRTFTDYAWPGNVRELENAVKRMVVLGSAREATRDVECVVIRATLDRVNWNRTKAARLLGPRGIDHVLERIVMPACRPVSAPRTRSLGPGPRCERRCSRRGARPGCVRA